MPIPTEQRATIFERFTKLDPSRSRPLLGSSGLGLAIVSEILKAHGSRIELVDGARGKSFRFRLRMA